MPSDPTPAPHPDPAPVPRAREVDGTLAFLREGYRFVGRRCDALGTDIFRTRLLGRAVICMRGADAAELFYDGDRFTRVGAMPPTTLRLLQDKGSVQALDGAAHRRRKALFMALMTPARIEALADLFEAEWRARLIPPAGPEGLVLLDAVRPVLAAAACRWAGTPVDGPALAARTRELAAMVDHAGSVGPAVVRALLLRRRAERWAGARIRAIRSGRETAPVGSAAAVFAAAHEDGAPLPEETAAVELLNVLRPTVAIDRFVVFAALALHRHPALGDTLARDPIRRRAFVEEVRRTTPFFPVIGGRATRAFSWKGHAFAEGQWTLLDLHGTNHHPGLFAAPEHFDPDRFLARTSTPYDVVPQGAGEHATGHRCPGEWATIAILDRAVALLAGAMRYDVPEQDLTVDLARMPARPKSGFVMTRLAPAGTPGSEE